MTVNIPNTFVMLATADGDLGVVPAAKASGAALEQANEQKKNVTVRDTVTDKVLATVRPGSTSRKRPARKRRLTELAVRRLKPAAAAFVVWDATQRGLGLRVRLRSKSWSWSIRVAAVRAG